MFICYSAQYKILYHCYLSFFPTKEAALANNPHASYLLLGSRALKIGVKRQRSMMFSQFIG